MTPVTVGDGICARCGKAAPKGMLVCDACQIVADAFNAAIRLHKPSDHTQIHRTQIGLRILEVEARLKASS